MLLLSAVFAARAREEPRPAHQRSVVSVEVTYQAWDEDRPWAKRAARARTVNAVLVDENHVLTVAHLLDDATFLKLFAFGRPRTGEPRIVHADYGVDLALVELHPDSLDGLEPAPVGERTPTSGVLQTVRWRGQQFESAASRVVRFEVARSVTSRVEHAFLQMRTDIAGGGWSEPVFNDGVLVGMTMSQSDQVSKAIPAEIIRVFLERAGEPGTDSTFPALGAHWQVNRDLALTRFLGQEGEPHGIVVRQIPWGSSACGVLEPMDILVRLDGWDIDAEGFYLHPRLGRLVFTHLLAERYRVGDEVSVTVVREGKEQELSMKLRGYPAALDLTPFRREGPPPFVIVGGLVLRELDGPYMQTWGKEWSRRAPVELRTRYVLMDQTQTPERRRIVLLTSVLPAADNIGYQDLHDEVVERVNGRPIGRIEDVVEALRTPEGDFQVIELAPDSTRRQVVLDATTLEASTAAILSEYRIPAASAPRAVRIPSGGGSCEGDY